MGITLNVIIFVKRVCCQLLIVLVHKQQNGNESSQSICDYHRQTQKSSHQTWNGKTSPLIISSRANAGFTDFQRESGIWTFSPLTVQSCVWFEVWFGAAFFAAQFRNALPTLGIQMYTVTRLADLCLTAIILNSELSWLLVAHTYLVMFIFCFIQFFSQQR